MRKKHFLYFIVISFVVIACGSSKTVSSEKIPMQVVSVGFYNLENLFDTIDGPNIDEEFLPNGSYRWTGYKYKSKLKNMAYAISQMGLEHTSNGVSMIGVAEVENRGVLEDLVKEPSLANRTYQIVHYDSPDRRGVDVGFLYNPRDFILSNSKSYRMYLPNDTAFRTRDQLMVSGYLWGEKVHVIVNHWPSRMGGELESEPKRLAAAALTKSIVDSLYKVDPKAKIMIMGDLNDDPANKSTAQMLNAKKTMEEVQPGGLFNTMWKIHSSGTGTLAYGGQWNLFDQIIVSEPLIRSDNQHLRFWKAEIFNRPFLTQQEGMYKGGPLRTTAGGIWQNGYSDHYPTLIYLVKEKK